eukprot:CAMPEP_0113511806 /NCGR_PEP_ID=MMETSP0014_2-20120614/38964_1 /TAXON_ID=2857 /ORGANISM="Nitzschia sp." /LENGTH=792 /DNA_ID=CAMNT_0000408045 /DNA_START=39 /DNA_END=2417 /DNA_ORIENTATION=+ /assembly_acc=CAM_ASM_000159
MAHSAHANAMAAHRAAQPPPGGSDIPGGGAAPPSSAGMALGADVVDKTQQLSLRQVRDLSKMPLVAIDLYEKESTVAWFPPKADDPSTTNAQVPTVAGKMNDSISLKANDAAHKTFKKWLNKDKTFDDLQAHVLAKNNDSDAVVKLEGPELWLGLRRLEDGPTYLKKMVNVDDSDTPAIAEESSSGVGVTLANGSLEGTPPQGDDFDRAVCKVRLCESKKALTVLPEEILQLVINQAQHHVALRHKATTGGDNNKKKIKNEDDEEESDAFSYPCAIAVPAPYCNDQSVEALIDATGGTGVILQRSVCAMAGSLVPSADENKPNMLLAHISKVDTNRRKEFQAKQIKNPDLEFDDTMIFVLAGVTKDAAECTAIQISSEQNETSACPFGNFQVICNVSYRSDKPESVLTKCISELYENMDTIAPEATTPLGFISYGCSTKQKEIAAKWQNLQKGLEDWENITHFFTRLDAVATGTAVLGAVSHGRLTTTLRIQGKKPKLQLALHVQNVAPVAVAMTTNYHGGQADMWTPPKTIFDFDRRVPAGPSSIDLVAAECALHRKKGGVAEMDDESFLKAVKEMEGAKGIPEREEAALKLRVQVLQKFTRDGPWIKIGDEMSPLVIFGGKDDEEETACEKVTLELSLGVSGLISSALIGDSQSVVQANKSARNSAIRWYTGVAFAILFFGGFLVKSYWEEHVFERDTRRLLSYYKHVIPGSMSDGDLHNARYLVWKYKNKKEKLWKSLEKKYGSPVLQEDEWPEDDENGDNTGESDEDHEDLDDKNDDEQTTGDDEGEL